MRAIVLVGGEGTRLRPLTLRTPKQLVPVLNRPLLDHLLLQLKRHGIASITLAMTRRSEAVREAFGDGERLGLDLEYAYEETPLGSGGAIASIAAGWRERFLVCNGDIVTDLDVTAFVEAHQARGAELSIALHEVEDPSAFGVVALDGAERITRFVEKPKREDAPSRWINAGFWLFEPSLVAEMDGTSFNRVEDGLFPRLAGGGRGIFGFRHHGYWMDVGNPEAYRRVNLDLLGGACAAGLPDPWATGGIVTEGAEVAPGARVSPPALLGTGTRLDAGATIEGPAVAGARCTLHEGAKVSSSVLWDDVTVGAGARVLDTVVASGARIEAGAHVEGAVIGHYATVAAGVYVHRGTRVEPDTVYTGE
ncbi:MAG: NDP-sugar synthase [Dehalococcoidia bacterium]|nr:NDP-sugar synthase [Dehalococcoidia bacterium]